MILMIQTVTLSSNEIDKQMKPNWFFLKLCMTLSDDCSLQGCHPVVAMSSKEPIGFGSSSFLCRLVWPFAKFWNQSDTILNTMEQHYS
mmetsp:Transcript_12865/g.18781  ORF Transcript_12865/g.18781 Transcript_12865/m.18781 type:complete len:88 (-) Transcript_12865:448-711(-)